MPRDHIPGDHTPADALRWYALPVEPLGAVPTDKAESGVEWKIRRRLRQREIPNWLPIEEIRSRRNGRWVNPRLVPYIPGFLFLHLADARKALGILSEIPGAYPLVCGASPWPTAIPNGVIAGLRALADRDGVIRHWSPPSAKFKVGQEVRIKHDPMDPGSLWGDFVGQIQELRGRDRASVLMGNLSRPVEVDVGRLEVV